MNRLAFAVTACILVSSLSEAEEHAQEILAKVKKKYDSVTDAQLTFTQRTTFALSKIEQSVNGILLMQKQNKYRVELDGQTIVTDGVTVWSYRPAAQQVLIDKVVTDESSLTPEKVLTGAPKDFSATVVGKEKVGRFQTTMLKLVPAQGESLVKSLRLWIDEDSWLIRQVEMTDINGKQVLYLVSDIKTNLGLPDARFIFEVPDGVEVVDLR